MNTAAGTSAPHSVPNSQRILSLMLGLLISGWLALAPILALAAGMMLFRFIPKSFSFFSLPPRPGNAPPWVIGLSILLVTALLQAAVFLPVWAASRRRPAWEPLHAMTGGLLLASLYMFGWNLAGLPFEEQSVFPSLIRLVSAAVFLGLIFLPLQRQAPARFVPSSLSTLLLAVGAAALLLLPWAVLGALGSFRDTLAALIKALAYGAGEEILLRGVVAALVARATGRPRIGFLAGIVIGLAMQPGYMLPLGDWVTFFRLFNTVAVALLASELAARGSLGAAILVHSAFEFGFPAWVDWRMEFSLPHPAAVESLGLVLVLGLFFAAVRIISNRISKAQPASLRLPVAAAFAVIALAGSSGAYAAWGNPGFTDDGFLNRVPRNRRIYPPRNPSRTGPSGSLIYIARSPILRRAFRPRSGRNSRTSAWSIAHIT